MIFFTKKREYLRLSVTHENVLYNSIAMAKVCLNAKRKIAVIYFIREGYCTISSYGYSREYQYSYNIKFHQILSKTVTWINKKVLVADTAQKPPSRPPLKI